MVESCVRIRCASVRPDTVRASLGEVAAFCAYSAESARVRKWNRSVAETALAMVRLWMTPTLT